MTDTEGPLMDQARPASPLSFSYASRQVTTKQRYDELHQSDQRLQLLIVADRSLKFGRTTYPTCLHFYF